MSDTIETPFHVTHRRELLLGLIVAAILLRFIALDRPTLWGDEALTYSRVTGTWEELFAILQNDGFMPLHYVLYWLLEKITTLTPSVMRIIPSLCGVLMVPAMYLLVRQISTVGAALFAAAFACTSGYLMRYSHDAKMYIQTWTFIALNLGFLFWWLRTHKWLGWSAWIVSGMIAGGFSALSMLMLVPQVVIFFTSGKIRIKSAGLFILGVIIIAAPVACYMSMVNQWTQKSGVIPSLSSKEISANWENSGISWVQGYNDYANGGTLIRGSLSAYLTGWEWPVDNGMTKMISPMVWSMHLGILAFIALALLLALLPWKKPDFFQAYFQGWQRMLWIAILLLIPVYGVFYCRSVSGFYSPVQVLVAAIGFFKYWNLLFIASIILGWFYCGSTNRERFKNAVPWIIAVTIIFCACQAMYFLMSYQHQKHWANIARHYGQDATPQSMPQLDWQSIWMPRYVGVVIPALVAGLAMLMMRLPGLWIKVPVITLILGFNLGASIVRMVYSPEPPMDRYMADAREVRDTRGKTRVVISTLDRGHRKKSLFLNSSWYGLYGSAGKYYASIILDLKPTPSEFRETDLGSRYRDCLGELYDPEEIEPTANQRWPGVDQPVEKLIVWDRANEESAGPEQIPQPDLIITILSKNWKLSGNPEIFYQYEANCWASKGYNRRREFVKFQPK